MPTPIPGTFQSLRILAISSSKPASLASTEGSWARSGQAEDESTKAARTRRKGHRRYSRWLGLMVGKLLSGCVFEGNRKRISRGTPAPPRRGSGGGGLVLVEK